MPRRDDISSILLIGSGPIVIGQACEFDYSGTQACRVLREEGYRVILANSNPATIMTDPDFADATYVEPLDASVLTKIIERERPDALLPTLGGQTALNLAMELVELGVLEREGVELIGANAEAIATAEDREQFKVAMAEIGLDTPESGIAHTLDEALGVVERIGLPVVIRPAYILGGRGTGIASTHDEFGAGGRDRHRGQPDLGDPDREVDRGLEGVRARGHARPRRQLRDHLLHREPRPDGRAHGRLDHRRAGPDAERRRVPAHARRRVRLHPAGRRRDGRLERAVRARPDQRRHGHHRDEPPRQPLVRAGVEGDRVPDRQDRGPPRRRLHARRDRQRHHRQDAGQLRAGHRLRRHQDPALGLREVPRHPGGARHPDAVGGRGHGHRADVPRVAAEGRCGRSSTGGPASTAIRARRSTTSCPTTSCWPGRRSRRPIGPSSSRRRCAAASPSTISTPPPASTRGSSTRSWPSSRSGCTWPRCWPRTGWPG